MVEQQFCKLRVSGSSPDEGYRAGSFPVGIQRRGAADISARWVGRCHFAIGAIFTDAPFLSSKYNITVLMHYNNRYVPMLLNVILLNICIVVC